MRRLTFFFIILALLIFLIFPLGEKGANFLMILFGFVMLSAFSWFLLPAFLVIGFCTLLFSAGGGPYSRDFLKMFIFCAVFSTIGIFEMLQEEDFKDTRRFFRGLVKLLKTRKKIIILCILLGCTLCWFSQPPIQRTIIKIEGQMWLVKKTNWWVGVSARAWDYIDKQGAETIKEIRSDFRIEVIKKDFQDRFHEWKSWQEKRKEKRAWTFSLAEVKSHSDTTCVHHLLRDWVLHGPGELNNPIIRKLNTELGTKLVSMLRRGEKFLPDDKLRQYITWCDIPVEEDAVVPMIKALQYPYYYSNGETPQIAPEELGTTRSELDSLLLLRERK